MDKLTFKCQVINLTYSKISEESLVRKSAVLYKVHSLILALFVVIIYIKSRLLISPYLFILLVGSIVYLYKSKLLSSNIHIDKYGFRFLFSKIKWDNTTKLELTKDSIIILTKLQCYIFKFVYKSDKKKLEDMLRANLFDLEKSVSVKI